MTDDFFMDDDNTQQDQRTIRFTPTLYVFLGSSPAQIGWRLKKLQIEAYGDLPIFQHLWIDTDSSIPPEVEPWLRNENVNRTCIGDVNPRMILENIDNFPSTKAWWPAAYVNLPSSLGPGAKQARLLGRLGLFGAFTRSIDDNLPIRETLINAAQRVLEISQAQAVTNMLHPDMDYELDLTQVRVYIVNSMCGGTGSGIAFDIAYLLREFISRHTDNYTIIGVQLLPPIFEKAIGVIDLRQKDKIKANAYSYLQDLDYLIEQSHWSVSYPSMDTDIKAPPFDMVYVVDLANKNGQILSEAMDVYKMVSQAMFLLSVSPMSGSQVSALANTSVLNPRFKGKIPYLSSFVSAALVYPKERILHYCSARLAMDAIDALRIDNYSEVGERPAHLTLIDELKLNPNSLAGQILKSQSVVNDQLDLILHSDDPGKALSYIASEMSNDEIERRVIIEKIEKSTKEITESIISSLRMRINELNALHGPFYTRGLIDAFIKDGSGKNSLAAYIKKVQAESDQLILTQYEEKLATAKNDLGDLSKKFLQSAIKWVFNREWKSKFNALKSEIISIMADLNAATLRKEVLGAIKELYSEVEEEAKELSLGMEQFGKRLEEVKGSLSRRMPLLLTPQTNAKLFQLTIEVVDSEYFIKYYQDRKPNIDPKRAFADFINNQTTASLASIKDAKITGLTRALMKAAETPFRESLVNANLLDELQNHYGVNDYLAVLEKKMDNVIDYCRPFWRYLPIHEDLITMAPAYIGVEDAQSNTIPSKFRNGGVYTLISTGVKDAIYIARAEHGVAPYMLTELPVLRKAYDNHRNSKDPDPLNIILDATRQDIDPDQSQSSAQLWVVALAMGYITRRGEYYYYDPDKQYKDSKKPKSLDRIAQGREKATAAFSAHYEWVNGVRNLINSEIANIGVAAANEKISAFRKKLDDESLSLDEENSIRTQLEKEIKDLDKAVTIITAKGMI